MFRMPRPVTITARSSSITNSFVNGVIPVILPTAEDVRAVLTILGMLGAANCAYCGDPHTEWDHLRPLVVAQRPTGYISEIQNLVPACGKCNQSKGNRGWREWMLSSARLSPKSRGVPDIAERIERLDALESWRSPTKVEFESVVSEELWNRHWQNHRKVLQAMREAEQTAAQIRASIAQSAQSDGRLS